MASSETKALLETELWREIPSERDGGAYVVELSSASDLVEGWKGRTGHIHQIADKSVTAFGFCPQYADT